MQDGTEISGTRQFSKPDCSKHRNNEPTNKPMDRCEGAGCKCPDGLVGVEPFCREPDAAYICSLPSRVGFDNGLVSCYAMIPKFFFNGATGNCEEFTYGGCGDPIANRFDNVQDCEKTCKQPSIRNDNSICNDGESKRDDCNTCTCRSGVWACTKRFCGPSVPTITGTRDAVCKDGESKKEDCNTCTCMGGVWACTLMGCFSPPTPTV